jgi:hypothetical protein
MSGSSTGRRRSRRRTWAVIKRVVVDRQRRWADSMSLNAIATPAAREPA